MYNFVKTALFIAVWLAPLATPLGHIEDLCCFDPDVLKVWNQVTNTHRPLSALCAPSIAARVVRRAVFGGPATSPNRP